MHDGTTLIVWACKIMQATTHSQLTNEEFIIHIKCVSILWELHPQGPKEVKRRGADG